MDRVGEDGDILLNKHHQNKHIGCRHENSRQESESQEKGSMVTNGHDVSRFRNVCFRWYNDLHL